MARRTPRCLGVAGAVGLAMALLVWTSLRPPQLAVPQPGLELYPVTVVNPGGGRSIGRRVVVRGERIERIDAAPDDGSVASFAGATVVPGLIDLHVHHPPAFAIGERELFSLLFLAHGVTSVRDAGSALTGTLRRHASAIAAGDRAGPRIFRCGPFLDGEPPTWPGARVVRDATEARDAVGELVEDGVHCVKLYNGLLPEAVAGILSAAREHGVPAIAHVPWSVSLAQLAGVEVQHLMGLTDDWNRVSAASVARYVEDSRSLGIRHVPTLVTFARAPQRFEPDAGREEPVGRLLPRYYRDLLWRPEPLWLAPPQATTRTRVDAMKRAVAALHEAGVPVLVGTDTMNAFVVPGVAVHEELGHLVDAGLSPEEAWLAATRRAGEALGVPGLGQLEPGAPADLLVFSQDPTRDLRALGTLRAVVARGRLYPKEVLDRAVEDALAHFHGFPYEPLSMGAASAALSWLTEAATASP